MTFRNTIVSFLSLALVATLSFGIMSCADDTTSTTTTTAANDTTLTDGQILQIAMTANQGEIMENQAAVNNLTMDSLRMFAQMMITDHTSALQMAQSLTGTASGSANLTAAPSQVSASLQREATGNTQMLTSMNGMGLDTTYAEIELVDHAHVLDMLDYTLIPNAANSQLKSYLTTMRTTVQNHLSMIRAIKENMR